MDVVKRAFPIIVLIMFQLLVLALLNLSFTFPSNAFLTGTMVNLLLPVNSILILLAFVSIAVVSRTFKNIEEEIENQVRLENQEHLKELLQTMRGQRHDFNHHFQTVYGFLSVNAYDEAKDYLEESLSEISVTNEIIRSDNPGLNALLYVKSGEMERHGITFSININSSIKPVLKASELNTVVGNLLDNAIQKLVNTPLTDSKIQFEAYRRGKSLILAVIDNGPLIEPHHLDKIFRPGFTTRKQGQGLGLYNVKQIVDKYGGEIHVKSEEGLTTFKISLLIKEEVLHEHS
ncbi:sensor histidine kinase [Desulfitobacterium sp. AusDCA]|uniref:sensor histidine kinase n=1 Tax=Desulfitobacterium sp. AusDCA TaxID=3240383 RepID=UPI003DA798D2